MSDAGDRTIGSLNMISGAAFTRGMFLEIGVVVLG